MTHGDKPQWIVKAGLAVFGILVAGNASAQRQQQAVTIQIESNTIQTPNAPAECTDFKKGPGGSWTPLKYIIITSGECSVIFGPGQVSFLPGIPSACDADIGSVLKQKCDGR
jgi:hypothetical protein